MEDDLGIELLVNNRKLKEKAEKPKSIDMSLIEKKIREDKFLVDNSDELMDYLVRHWNHIVVGFKHDMVGKQD
jgi:hypothetical protein